MILSLWLAAHAADLDLSSCPDRPCAEALLEDAWSDLGRAQPPTLSPGPAPPPSPLPAAEQHLLDAFDLALSRYPEPSTARILWLARSGELLYRHCHLDDAASRLQQALDLDPNLTVSEAPALLLLDLHALRQQWPDLESLAATLRSRPIAPERLRRDLPEIEAAAAFRRIESMQGDLDIARAYLSVADRFPQSRAALTALQNAAPYFERARSPEEALAVRERLLASAKDLDPRVHAHNLLTLALDCMHLQRPDAAASYFERFAALPPDPATARDRADALFNAALLREQLGQTELATNHFEQWLASSPDDPQAPQIRLHTADLYLASHKDRDAERLLRAISLTPRDRTPWLDAQLKLGQILTRRSDTRARDALYTHTLQIFAQTQLPPTPHEETTLATLRAALGSP